MTSLMVYDLSGVDVFFLAKELTSLEGSKVDKIVQLDKKMFLFRFFQDKKKQNVRILVPEIINITEQKYDSPLLPLGFCSFLRKYLQNTRLKKVHQINFERIILLEFESAKNGELVMILEFFKPGNMILCKKEGDKLTILNSLQRQVFKDRTIEARQEYVFPPKQNNPSNMTLEYLSEVINKSDKILAKTLAIDFSLGGLYAEEIIFRSELNKECTKISADEKIKLLDAFDSFFSQKVNCGKFKGKIFPTTMLSFSIDESFESFSQGLDSILLETVVEEQKTSVAKQKKSKTASLLEIQTKRIRDIEKEIDEAQKTGEFMYEHYSEFQTLISKIKELREKNESFDEIESILNKNKHFKKLDKAKKIVHMKF